MKGLTRYRSFLAAAAVLAVSAGWHTGVQPDLAAQSAAAESSLDPAFVSAFKWRSIGPDRGGRSIAVSGVKGRPRRGLLRRRRRRPLEDDRRRRDLGRRSPTARSQLARSARSPCPNRTPTSSTSAWASRASAATSSRATASTSRPTPARPGRTSAFATPTPSRRSASTRPTPTSSSSPPSASYGGRATNAASSRPPTAARPGRRCSSATTRPARSTSRSTANNPNVMYAALWEAYRVEYPMSSGGPGSGLFKSTDGGETWTEITRNPGLPAGHRSARSASRVSGADPNRVYALVENANGGLFRLRRRRRDLDAGQRRPQHPPARVLLHARLRRSAQQGHRLRAEHERLPLDRRRQDACEHRRGTHGDYHDIWIDPDDPQHVMHANDGGGAVTYQRGAGQQRSWTAQDYPTGAVLPRGHDRARAVPRLRRAAGQQHDVRAERPPARAASAAAARRRRGPTVPYPVGGAEPGYIAPDPNDPDVFFAGGNNGSFITRSIAAPARCAKSVPYPRIFSGEPSSAVIERWQWTFPIVFSPVDPNVLYTVVAARVEDAPTADRPGTSISDDLTRHDPKTMGTRAARSRTT